MTPVLFVATSLIWGGLLVGAGLYLQRGMRASGAARQWVWRACAAFLVLPWVAAPLVAELGLGMWPVGAEVAGYEGVMHAPMIGAAPEMADVAAATSAPAQAAINWLDIVALVLLGGWLVRFVAAQMAARSLGRILVHSRCESEGPAFAAVTAWSRRLGLKRIPELRIASDGVSPFSCGVLRPVVCLPEGLEQQVDREALDLIVGHECMHIARGDGWRRPVERLVADVFWFNPFAWRMRSELDLARELACDEAIMAVCAKPRAYARTLRVVAGRAAGLSPSAPAAAMSLAGRGAGLVMRMNRALDGGASRPRRSNLVGAIALAVLAAPAAIAQVAVLTPRDALEAPEAPPAPPAPEAPEAPEAPAIAPLAPLPELVPLQPLPGFAPLAPLPVLPVIAGPNAPPEPPAAPAPAPAPKPVPALRLDGAAGAIVDAPARISSKYGARKDPFNGSRVFHSGVDIAREIGADIYAPVGGVVTFAGERGSVGNVVELAVSADIMLRFAHVGEIKVTEGQTITAGTVVGLMGLSGLSTGAHVHLEVYLNGETVDPQTVGGLTLIGPA